MLGFSNTSIGNFLFWFTQKKWFLISISVGLFLHIIGAPDGLSVAGYNSLIITVTALIMIISEPISLPGIALYIIISEVFLGLGTPNEVAKSFMNDAVFFIMGSLMLAVVIIKQGWDARLALGIIKLTGNKVRNIVVGLLSISAFLSSFIGEHTVAAIMLPIGMTIIRYSSKLREDINNLSCLILFSIAYGALIGSVGTPSGGGRNAIMLNYLGSSNISISYLRWIYEAYPFIIIQIPIASFLLLTTFKSEVKILDSSVRKLVIQVSKLKKMTGRNTMTIMIFFMIFFSWIFLSEKYGLGVIALTGVLFYMVGGFIRWEDISKNTHWGVILLFGSTISLGSYINKTGAAEWLANKIIFIFGPTIKIFPFFADLITIVMTTVLANILSSSATVAVLGPINMNLGVDVKHIGLLTAMASSFGFFTAVAAPACTIIYSSGMIKAKDFIKIGWKIGLISIFSLLIYVNIYWSIIN